MFQENVIISFKKPVSSLTRGFMFAISKKRELSGRNELFSVIRHPIVALFATFRMLVHSS